MVVWFRTNITLSISDTVLGLGDHFNKKCGISMSATRSRYEKMHVSLFCNLYELLLILMMYALLDKDVNKKQKTYTAANKKSLVRRLIAD